LGFLGALHEQPVQQLAKPETLQTPWSPVTLTTRPQVSPRGVQGVAAQAAFADRVISTGALQATVATPCKKRRLSIPWLEMSARSATLSPKPRQQ
jgi:hypothetical protein